MIEEAKGNLLEADAEALVNTRYIISFPTKRHWRGRSRIEDIDSSLEALVGEIRRLGIRSIAVPPLGAVRGQPQQGARED
jgi:O-acetyl-ADP-ribose deacetylase (regulator of RNase III)